MSDHVASVQAIYAAFGRGDVPAFLAHLDEDVDWEHDWGSPPLSIYTPRRGRAEVAKFFAALHAIEITRFEPINLLAGGNQVAAVIRLGLTVKATGQAVTDLEMHLWTFGTDGKVTGLRHICDTHQLARAGLV